MKTLVFIPFVAALSLNVHNSYHFLHHAAIDTAGIHHVQDGIISEWTDSSFQMDKTTSIHYAADNDGQNLYVAMKIPDFRMQMKIMRMGMSLYIDLKGKKKENRGIEFPIKREGEGGFSGGGFGNNQSNDQNQQGNTQQQGFDKKAMRSRYAIYMLSMKLFGFSDDEVAPQELQRVGSVNLNYSWEATDVMYIEYLIPLNMLGDAASLNQKTISIGWKINGIDASSFGNGNLTSSSSIVTQSSNGRTTTRSLPTTNTSSNNASSNRSFDSMMEEQSFWTKYTFH
jgi:hypothetical protein